LGTSIHVHEVYIRVKYPSQYYPDDIGVMEALAAFAASRHSRATLSTVPEGLLNSSNKKGPELASEAFLFNLPIDQRRRARRLMPK
jgi:hypothetical protein